MDPSQRYTIDELLAHPWCNAVPAPPAPPTPRNYSGFTEEPLDSPLLCAARGRIQEGKSPGIALKEAIDVSHAVHLMEEEGARRRKFNGRAVGVRGFLSNLNEDDEDERGDGSFNEDEEQSHQIPNPATIQEGRTGSRDVNLALSGKRSHRKGTKEFELDMRGATLLGRRYKKSTTKSPLSTQYIQAEPDPLPELASGSEYIGSPMHS